MPKFEIHSKLGGRFYFAFKMAHETIFASRDFSSRESCEEAIKLIKETPFEDLYDINVSSDDEYLFCIKDKKERVIGCSNKPVPFSELNKRISLVRHSVKVAEVVDVDAAIKSDLFVH